LFLEREREREREEREEKRREEKESERETMLDILKPHLQRKVGFLFSATPKCSSNIWRREREKRENIYVANPKYCPPPAKDSQAALYEPPN